MQYPNEIGFDDFTKPDLSSEDLPAILPKSSAREHSAGSTDKQITEVIYNERKHQAAQNKNKER